MNTIQRWQDFNAKTIAEEIVDSRQCLKWAQEEINELRAELAALKNQEPVAYRYNKKDARDVIWMHNKKPTHEDAFNIEPLYLAAGAQPVQAQEQRKPLTFDQIENIWVDHGLDECDCHGFARAIEADHGITGEQP